LKQLGAQLIEEITNKEFAWQHYTNKTFALLTAEAALPARQYVWLDSDVLVVAEPEALWLGPDEDFVACAPDTGALGSTGAGDSRDAAWKRACSVLGVGIDGLPWVDTFKERSKIRFYMNSGVFAYGGGTGFAQAYFQDCMRFLRAQQSRSHAEVHFMDQLVLGLTVHRLGLRWRLLPHSCNYGCHSKLLDWIDLREFTGAQILHYHDMMQCGHWHSFCNLLESANHPLYAELIRLGPLIDPSGPSTKVIREALRLARGLKRRLYYRSCGFRW
jgi:hypothetical protein